MNLIYSNRTLTVINIFDTSKYTLIEQSDLSTILTHEHNIEHNIIGCFQSIIGSSLIEGNLHPSPICTYSNIRNRVVEK